MKLNKTIASVALAGALFANSIILSFADGTRVVTLGESLSEEQRETMLKFFGVQEDEVLVLEVNNKEEREYLEGIATEAQLGRKTFSCSYVEPTKAGSGINVKLANLTWLTSSMVASTLSTAGIKDANVIVAANIPVSGTGAITGILKGLEDAYGISLDEDKKELASEELIITGNLGDEIGPDKATGIVNDIKTEIIKNNTKDTVQIAETINNVTNNYNITLSKEQQKDIELFMSKIAQQDYDYKEMKDTLKDIKKTINEKLDSMGESVEKGILDTLKEWFTNIGEWVKNIFSSDKDLGILENTNDSVLGENAHIDSTEEIATSPDNGAKEESVGFFEKLWNWFTGLFNKQEESEKTDIEQSNNEESDSDNSNKDIEDPSNNTGDGTIDIKDDLSDELHIDTDKDIEESSEEKLGNEDNKTDSEEDENKQQDTTISTNNSTGNEEGPTGDSLENGIEE